MSVVIRRLGPDDWATLRAARLAMLADSPGSYRATYAEDAARDEQAWREVLAARAWFVAHDGGRVVGIACGGEQREPDPAARALRSMWVAPSHRGHGVADALVDAVATWARTDGASVLSLWALAPASRAHAFYRRYGFTPGTEVHEVDGSPHVGMTRYTLALTGDRG